MMENAMKFNALFNMVLREISDVKNGLIPAKWKNVSFITSETSLRRWIHALEQRIAHFLEWVEWQTNPHPTEPFIYDISKSFSPHSLYKGRIR